MRINSDDLRTLVCQRIAKLGSVAACGNVIDSQLLAGDLAREQYQR